MPLKIPADLKKITQYIRRAEELDNDSSPQTRVVAYYCRQYAVQIGIPLATTPPGRECLGQILGDLEKEKKAMSTFSKDEGYQICRAFAMKIFDKADGVDRMGNSDKKNAKSFYAAASFLDTLSHFHDGSQGDEDKSEEVLEEEKKSFYAKWKATDILKAIREGREVKPGGFGEDPEETEEDDEEAEAEVEVSGGAVYDDTEPTEAGTEVSMDGIFAPPPPPYPGMTPVPPPAAPIVEPKPAQTSPPRKKSSIFGGRGGGGGSGKYTKAVLGDAKELTSFALKALKEKDGDLAIERLQQALEVLMQG